MSDKLIPRCRERADNSALRHREQKKAIKATALERLLSKPLVASRVVAEILTSA
jgi:hypothetical protein